jgi:hypothetical protein
MTTATKPGTNGPAHERNGQAPASRQAGVPQQLDAVSHGETGEAQPAAENKTRPQDGRTAQGTFAPGNKCARGNPTARKMAALRSALLGNLTAQKMAALGDKLYAAALSGDWIAAKLLLTYAVGKAPEAVSADRLDLDEWKLLNAAPTLAQLGRAWLDGISPTSAVEVLKKWYDSNETGDFQKLQEGRYFNVENIGDERKARVGK